MCKIVYLRVCVFGFLHQNKFSCVPGCAVASSNVTKVSSTGFSSGPVDESFCIKKATLGSKPFLMSESSKTCTLHTCLSQTDNQMPVYRRLRDGYQLILFRTISNLSVNPFLALRDFPINKSQLELPDMKKDWYKSPLTEVASIDFLNTINLLLYKETNGSRVMKVNLTFNFDLRPKLSNISAWFARGNLLSSFPWSKESLKNHTVNFTSIYNASDPSKRIFFISQSGDNSHCKGFFYITEGPCLCQSICPSNTALKFMYSYSPSIPDQIPSWETHSLFGDELIIMGRFAQLHYGDRYYIRHH